MYMCLSWILSEALQTKQSIEKMTVYQSFYHNIFKMEQNVSWTHKYFYYTSSAAIK